MTDANFISQADALELIGRKDVAFVDGSWYLPAQERDGHAEYRQMRIPGAVYFDIDSISDQASNLPHMLPTPDQFAQKVSLMGIADDDLIIVYDGPGLFSAPRVWWTFKTMGAIDVRILDGGLDQWKSNNLPLETGNPNPRRAKLFSANFAGNKVASIEDVIQASKSGNPVVLDARPSARFAGKAPEPRPGLRGGHIPGSKNLPANTVIENGRLKSSAELKKLFESLDLKPSTPIITSCGSGVTAAILALALDAVGYDHVKVYDGSWAEWGLPEGPEIETDDSE
ncbi:MAG: 3-mercaptopyruvate sulfurtransferase [Pseudomonadota bacterium]